MKSIRVATCQFSVEGRIEHNRRWVLKQIEEAAGEQADVVHFSECALSGYAGVDLPGIADLNWDELTVATRDVMAAAKKQKVWVLLGSTHRLDDQHKPHNCIYVINPKGQIADRYDKRFCTGEAGKKPTLDLCHYTPGDRFVTFKVKGMTCGVAICYDYRFPELYRGYQQLGVEVLFQSFHNARKTVAVDPKYNIWKTIVPATMQCRAAENHFWVSANNSTTRPSCWGSFAVQPDGEIVGRLPVHQAGVLLTEMKMDPACFDAPAPWRPAAMSGQLHSGQLLDHPRSRDTTSI
ncbi:MAG: carbon-nitrogen hydrolase family protein [Planctomycetes bacterium]|nr:carbon-nitrogen hydrolase family protein [Planctomycetota bacterium]